MRLGTQPYYYFGNTLDFKIFITHRGQPFNGDSEGDFKLVFDQYTPDVDSGIQEPSKYSNIVTITKVLDGWINTKLSSCKSILNSNGEWPRFKKDFLDSVVINYWLTLGNKSRKTYTPFHFKGNHLEEMSHCNW